MRTRVKICCISSVAEARTAVAAGADAIGLVSAMPSGPGVIDEDLIAVIAAVVPPAIGTFLLTSEVEPASIIAQQRRCGVNTIQFCDALDRSAYPVLRDALPGIALIQVIHVRGEGAVAEAVGLAPMIDGLLLDSGNPTGTVKELGGTGRVHNWALSRRIVVDAPCPVFLAGGLNPGNVADAIHQVRPYGVDLCTGVRTEDALDPGQARRLHGRGRRSGRSGHHERRGGGMNAVTTLAHSCAPLPPPPRPSGARSRTADHRSLSSRKPQPAKTDVKPTLLHHSQGHNPRP